MYRNATEIINANMSGYSFGYNAPNNPNMPYGGKTIGVYDGQYTGNNPTHDKKPWEKFFGQLALEDRTPTHRRHHRENYNLPEAFDVRSSYMEKVMITNITEVDWWEFVMFPMKRKDDTVLVNLDRWIFHDHLAGRTPSEAPTRLVTSEWQEGSEYMLRHGLSMIFDHDFWKTEKGQFQYQENIQQIQNAVVTTAAMGAVYAALRTDPYRDVWLKRNNGRMDRQAFERVLRDGIATFGIFQKSENGVELADNKARGILRERTQRDGDFTVVPYGSMMYVNFARPERKHNYLNGKVNGSPKDRIVGMDSGMIVESRSYRGDSTEPTHDPFFHPRVIGGRFHLGRHNLRSDTRENEFRPERLNTKIYDEDQDDFVCIDYRDAVLNHLGLWCDGEPTDVAEAFFDKARNRKTKKVSSLISGNGWDSDSDGDSHMSSGDDSDDDERATSGVMSAYDWFAMTDRVDEAVETLAKMSTDAAGNNTRKYEDVYHRVFDRQHGTRTRFKRKARKKKLDLMAKRVRVSEEEKYTAPAVTSDREFNRILDAEVKKNTDTTGDVDAALGMYVFDSVSKTMRIFSRQNDIQSGLIHIAASKSTGAKFFTSGLGTVAFHLMHSTKKDTIDDYGDAFAHLFGLLEEKKQMKLFTAVESDVLTDASSVDGEIFSVTTGVGTKDGHRLSFPFIAEAIRLVRSVVSDGKAPNTLAKAAALIAAIVSSSSNMSVSTDPVVFDPRVSKVTTNMRMLASHINRGTADVIGHSLFPVYDNKSVANDFASYQFIDFIKTAEKCFNTEVDDLRRSLRANALTKNAKKTSMGIFKKWSATMTKKMKTYIELNSPKHSAGIMEFLESSRESDSLFALATFAALVKEGDDRKEVVFRMIDEYTRDPFKFRDHFFADLVTTGHNVPKHMFPPSQLLGMLISQENTTINGREPQDMTKGFNFAGQHEVPLVSALNGMMGGMGDGNDAKDSVEDDIIRWLHSMRMNDFAFVTTCLNCDVDPCISIIGWRPHKQYETGTMLRMQAHGVAGSTFHGNADFMLQKQASQKKVYGNYTIWMKSIVQRPEHITQVRDVFIRDYLGGNGTRILDPCNETHIASIKTGDYSVGDIFLCAVPATWKPTCWYSDITGYFSDEVRHATGEDEMLWPTADIYSQVWGFSPNLASNPLNVDYYSGNKRRPLEQVFSSICIQEAQHNYGGTRITEQGHLGEPYPGLAGVHRGEIKTQLTKDGLPGYRIHNDKSYTR